jgi:SAM-dependent methyltransferase
MADLLAEQRTFSEKQHDAGRWRTRTMAPSDPVRRAIVSFLSFKRAGVDRLARRSRRFRTVVDLGAGQGAYSRWFLAVHPVTIIAVDWSPHALQRIPPPRPGRGKLLRLCADAQRLPLKAETADCLFSVDMLGHLSNVNLALDEILRIVKPGAPLFLHSECGSYRLRWPDAMLLSRLGYDYGARLDGHETVLPHEELRALFARRFIIESSWSPAGTLGWLTGYPENYREAFKEAGCNRLAALTGIFAFIKKAPLLGTLLRLVNVLGNRLELALGVQGGGSFFAFVNKPEDDLPPSPFPHAHGEKG